MRPRPTFRRPQLFSRGPQGSPRRRFGNFKPSPFRGFLGLGAYSQRIWPQRRFSVRPPIFGVDTDEDHLPVHHLQKGTPQLQKTRENFPLFQSAPKSYHGFPATYIFTKIESERDLPAQKNQNRPVAPVSTEKRHITSNSKSTLPETKIRKSGAGVSRPKIDFGTVFYS